MDLCFWESLGAGIDGGLTLEEEEEEGPDRMGVEGKGQNLCGVEEAEQIVPWERELCDFFFRVVLRGGWRLEAWL